MNKLAHVGAELLFQSDDALRIALRKVGALQSCTTNDGSTLTDSVSLSAVLKVFHQICYVIVRKPGHAPHPHISEPLCTCVSCCRYASCEHVEYVKMLNLRLREATSTKDTLPENKRRGPKARPNVDGARCCQSQGEGDKCSYTQRQVQSQRGRESGSEGEEPEQYPKIEHRCVSSSVPSSGTAV